MEGSSRDDIRALLKSFGIKADEVIIAHMARNPGDKPLKLKLIMKDISDYGGSPPAETLHLEIDGEIRR